MTEVSLITVGPLIVIVPDPPGVGATVPLKVIVVVALELRFAVVLVALPNVKLLPDTLYKISVSTSAPAAVPISVIFKAAVVLPPNATVLAVVFNPVTLPPAAAVRPTTFPNVPALSRYTKKGVLSAIV